MIKNVLSAMLIAVFALSVQAQSVGFRLNNYSMKQGTNMTDKLIQGAEIGYFKHLNKFFDLYLPLRLGPRGDVETIENSVKTKTSLTGNMGVDANLQAKYDNGHNRLVPFVSAGIGTELYDTGLELGAPVGAGLNIRITPNVFITLATNYRLALAKSTPTGWMHSVGIRTTLPKRERRESDYDSERSFNEAKIAAAKQKTAAEAKAKADAEAQLKARIIAESDAKIKLEEENRAKLAAEAKAKADARAAALASASMPDQPVVVSAEIKKVLDFAVQGVQFELGSALLLKESYSNLDEVATTMAANPELRISLEGHTDRTGTEGINLKLSEARAKACSSYLISKGIASERLREVGFGSARPISDNETESGRKLNRRVEFVPW